MHNLPAWGDPYFLEGGSGDGDCGQDHGDGGGDGCDGIMSDICDHNCSSLGKAVIGKLAGERRGVDLCQPQGNT